jgi:calcineurin-like phosphoesterase family protein
MDEAMHTYWNETVKPDDKVYVLGDWCINRKSIKQDGLNGRKILIKGNHDIFRLHEYAEVFDDIRAYHVLTAQRVILSHIPVHPNQLERWRANIHGHLHSNVVMHEQAYEFYRLAEDGLQKEVKLEQDKRYKCVSVEHTNFRPVLLDKVLEEINEALHS